jgi:perosamine synthetase
MPKSPSCSSLFKEEASGSSDMLPYGRHSIDDVDVEAVVEALRSEWLTTGPRIEEFERAVAYRAGSKHAVAVSSGTAGLHAAVHAIGIGPGDEVIVPSMTFAASANCIVYQGGTPVFADVDPDTLLIDPDSVLSRLTPRTRAIVSVDFAGQPCDYTKLQVIAKRYDLALLADACHSFGGAYQGRPVGSLAKLSVFSFHPVKLLTTGEGGMICTDDSILAERMRIFRNHGITSDHRQRAEQGAHFYEMVELGFNYRVTDFQCALGLSQLRKLHRFVKRRQEIAARYDAALELVPGISPLKIREGISHAYHLYPVLLDREIISADRSEIFAALRAEGIGVNVHYIPVHLHPFYRARFGTGPGLCPIAEDAYSRLLSLPIFPAMSWADVQNVLDATSRVVARFSA